MKKYFILILYILIASVGFAQDFEGVIEFDFTYKSKDTRVSVEELMEYGGTHSVVFIKNGFYKSIDNSNAWCYQLFRHDTDSIYYKHGLKDDTLRRFSTISTDIESSFDYSIERNADTVLGIVCDKLVITDDDGQRIYYFSREYPQDASFFENFTKNNRDQIQKLIGAVYLRQIIVYAEFEVDMVATSIKRMTLPEDTFDLPIHKVIKEE